MRLISSEIVPKAKKIISNKKYFIDVEVGECSIIIKMDNRIMYESKKEWKLYDKNILYDECRRFDKKENIIYSFRTIGTLKDETIEEIYQAFDYIKSFIVREMIVCKVNRDAVLKENKKSTNGLFKCLIKDKEDFYFVYFKMRIRDKYYYFDDPVLYFLVNRIQNEKFDKTRVKNIYEYKCENEANSKWDDYAKYILEMVFRNVNVDSFFDVNFVRQESNNFIKCMNLIYSKKRLDDILRSYLENLSEYEIKNFIFTYSHCLTGNMNRRLRFYYDLGKYKYGLKESSSYLKSLLPVKYKNIVVENPFSSSFESFFIYQLRDNRDFIMNYKKNFMEIMEWQIYIFLQFLCYEVFKEKILEVIILNNQIQFEKDNFSYSAVNEDETTQEKTLK